MARQIKKNGVAAEEAVNAKKTVKADNAKKTVKANKEEKEFKTPKTEKKGGAAGKRVAAILFWLLAIAAEAAAICLLNGYLYLPYDLMTMLIVCIVVDLIFVIIGSQFWKKANRINPPSEKNKVWFFICSQMGLIAAIIAFVPLIVLLLKNKNLDKKTKRIVSIIAAVALIIAGAASIDYDPISKEDLEAANLMNTEVYWTQYGRSYHADQECQSITRSKNVYAGSVDEAFQAKRNDPCDFCALELDAKLNEVKDDILAGETPVLDEIMPEGSDALGEAIENIIENEDLAIVE